MVYYILYPQGQRSTLVQYQIFWPLFNAIAQKQHLDWHTEAYNRKAVILV